MAVRIVSSPSTEAIIQTGVAAASETGMCCFDHQEDFDPGQKLHHSRTLRSKHEHFQ